MSTETTRLPFIKMHGLGNDFIIFDGRTTHVVLSDEDVRLLASRTRGIGCDQLIVLTMPPAPKPQAFMEIYNADGSRVGACGNAARCVAQLLLRETGLETVSIQTDTALLTGRRPDARQIDTADTAALITVDMGPARLSWQEIPLRETCDTLSVPVSEGPLRVPVCVNMGNPHAVFFVEDADAVDLQTLGPLLESHAIFPEKANISVAHVKEGALRLRVFERGTGITEACGTAACAAAVAAIRRGLLAGPHVAVELDGGPLYICWEKTDSSSGPVEMTGAATEVFRGDVDLGLLRAGAVR